MTLGPIGRAAVEYARRGFAVIRLHSVRPDGSCSCPQGASCKSPGKHPRASNWQNDWSKDPAFVAGLWSNCAPDDEYNVGIVAGPSGLAIVDIDGEYGQAAFGRLTGGDVGDCPMVKTGRGYHLYFRDDPVRPMRPVVGTGDTRGLDLRAGPSFVVAPPSRHASGGQYEFLIDGVEPPPMPAVLRQAFANRTRTTVDADGAPIPAGARNSTLASLAGTMRRRGMVEAEIRAALLAVNEIRCDPPLDSRDVARIAWSVCRYEPADPLVRDVARGEMELDTAGELTDEERVYKTARFEWLDVSELLATPPPEPDWLWDGLIEKGELVWVAGAGKAGKSMLVLFLAASALAGKPAFLGRKLEPVERVVYLDCENRKKTIHRRLHYAGIPKRLADGLRYAVLRGADLGSEEGLEAFDVATRDGGLVILDSLVGVHRIDENAANEVRSFVAPLRNIAERNGATLIGLAHENRAGNLRGNLDWRNVADTVLSLQKADDGWRKLGVTDKRDGDENVPAVTFRFIERDGRLMIATTAKDGEQ